jgi:hypothetical protein
MGRERKREGSGGLEDQVRGHEHFEAGLEDGGVGRRLNPLQNEGWGWSLVPEFALSLSLSGFLLRWVTPMCTPLFSVSWN